MMNLVALPCLCVDVFDGTDELRAGGEALNFAVHASKFEEFNVSILGAVGQDFYAKFIMDSISDKRIDVSHVRVEKDKVTANNRTYLTADGDRYYKDDSWTGDIVDKMILNQDELDFIKNSEVVFVHFWAGCFGQIIGLKNNNTGVIYTYPVPKSIQGQIYGMTLVNVNKDNQSFSLVNRSNGDILLSDIQPCASITVIRV